MREPAPPYRGEGPHALWHVSEDDSIRRFRPRSGLVWAVDTRHQQPHPEVGGYWLARVDVEPLELVDLGDLAARHEQAGIELRAVPELRALWEEVVASTLEFSGIRLRNAR